MSDEEEKRSEKKKKKKKNTRHAIQIKKKAQPDDNVASRR
jgi:hypothetical protein